MGMPVAIKREQVAEWVRQHGGQRVIQRILVASNGIAALKCIRSMRRLSYETFGTDLAFHFIVMATPEDVKANAEYIHMADQLVEVPGGSNNNNYANVHLITQIAVSNQADAVWAGWGHASENPELADALNAVSVAWIGPSSSAMRALGDKVSSTLIAQSAGVTCLPWSGSGLDPHYVRGEPIADEIYRKACAKTSLEAEQMASSIGFPVMIKASGGGGGKGIRHCNTISDVANAFRAVQAEVPGSPVFLMRMVSNVRHLEVQLLVDEWGTAISLFGRDCSIQRRHQKIIEEGPVVAAPPTRWQQMEQCAIRLAKAVGYVGAGTVEYLYDEVHDEFAFLELNPRLQVEHPVTELISGVNLPAAQLQVAMGIPLFQISEIRQLFVTVDPTGPIDFESCVMVRPACHVIACRITAENPDEGFRPSSGSLEDLNFRSTPHVWGYFSIGSQGGVHEFADSQFGHLFAVGANREHARLHMSMALKELSVRGEISTTIEYLQSILETHDFKNNLIHTRWLETQTQTKSVALRPTDRNAVLLSASYLAWHALRDARKEFISQIERGRLVDVTDTEGLNRHVVTFRYRSHKYTISASLTGPFSISLFLGEYGYGPVTVRELNGSKGLLLSFEGRTYSVYGHSGRPLRVSISGQTVVFTDEIDPTRIRAQMSGKLLRYVVDDGCHAEKGQVVAEMEVMKMYIPVLIPADGVVHHVSAAGNNVNSGDVLLNISLDDPSAAEQALLPDFIGPFDHGDPRPTTDGITNPEQVLVNCLDGYDLDWSSVAASLKLLMQRLRDPLLPLQSLRATLSTLDGRINAKTMAKLQSCAATYQRQAELKRFPWENAPEFPADAFLQILDQISEPDQCAQFSELRTVLTRYVGGGNMYTVRTIDVLLQRFLRVEERFATPDPSEVVIQSLLSTMGHEEVASIVVAHRALPIRTRLITLLLETMESDLWPLMSFFKSTLYELASCNGRYEISRISLAARRLLTRLQLPPLLERSVAIRALLQARNPLLVTQQDITDCLLHTIDTCRRMDSLRLSALAVYANRLHRTSTLRSSFITPRGMVVSVFSGGNVVVWVSSLQTLLDDVDAIAEGDISMLHICVMADKNGLSDDDTLAAMLLKAISSLRRQLNGTCFCFAVIPSSYVPLQFAFSLDQSIDKYVEERLIRGVEPSLAPLLELDRLLAYEIIPLPTIHQSVRLFSGVSRIGKSVQKRLFARCIVRLASGLESRQTTELHRNEAEAALQDALQSIEVACGDDQYRDNHVFLNFILHSDTNEHELVLLSLFRRYSAALTRCRVTSAEVRIEMSLPETCRPTRYVCTNPTGLVLIVETYKESSAATPLYVWDHTLYISTKGESAGQMFRSTAEAERGALHGTPCNAPYPIQSDLDRRRRIAQSVHTLLPYDFLSLFSYVLRCKNPTIDSNGAPFIAVELCRLEDADGVERNAVDSEALHVHGLCAVNRPIGSNMIGMVGWLCKIYSDHSQALREVVIIANDITHQMGTFGVAEDEFFLRCSRYARQHCFPRLYIAGNSGARIGLAHDIEPFFQVAWNDPSDHRKGFSYLYVDPDARDRFSDWIVTSPVTVSLPEGGVETRYRIDGIIGSQQSIGVENLAGSGAIAGETSAAYRDTFTLSYASTRSVGIGAYLLRLGQRVIQKTGGQAPIILTGFGALNKLLGSNVYKSNRQLGGSGLMAGNGISHQIVTDDMEGVRAMLHWLEFVALSKQTPLSFSTSLSTQLCPDSIERPLSNSIVDFSSTYDPRILLKGDHERNIPGLFDAGTWVETLQDWARTAICGRARIGSIPVGVVAVEIRSQNKITPPDPVMPESRQSSRHQPGCVLFPDSAFKVSQSIRDFAHENLPIIIMANWRGFSGGQRDMHDEVLKYGAMIVDALRDSHVPVIVYLPPGSELRGGAWVVVDRNVNRNIMEMYADPTSRGGVMEPAGVVDVKFRQAKIESLAARLNPSLLSDRARFNVLRSVYVGVAEKFADLHDTPYRMQAVNAINGIVAWENCRSFFYWRLRRRLTESLFLRDTSREVLLHAANMPPDNMDVYEIDLLRIVFGKLSMQQLDFSGHDQDADIVEWLENNNERIREELSKSHLILQTNLLLQKMGIEEKTNLLQRLHNEIPQNKEN